MTAKANIAAIILSAGFSSRLPQFKPLLPLGETTALGRAIALFENCGVTEIQVVTGHRAEALAPVMAATTARPVFNPGYAEGMFSSVVAGVRALKPDCPAFFILPADVPLVRPSTVRALLSAFTGGDNRIYYPTFDGRRGHPPLIDSVMIPRICDWKGPDGLKSCLVKDEHLAVEVPVADEAILLDMDTAETYALLMERLSRHEIPTEAECRALMRDVHPVPRAVWDHCRAVAQAALAIGAALNRAGLDLDLALIQAAGLVHDVARGQEDHAAVGARLLADLGFPKVAAIVAVHMDIAVESADALDEGQVVFLADKLVGEDRTIGLDRRFERKMEKYGGDPAVVAAIGQRRNAALSIARRIEKTVGNPLEAILAGGEERG